MTRWFSKTSGVTAWLDESHRTPRLVLAWPTIDGWTDEGAYAFEQVLAPGTHARRVVTAYLGTETLASITETIASVRRHAGEDRGTDTRTWSRTVGRGFCTGDLDDVDWVVATVGGVHGGGYTHSYGVRSGESSWAVPHTEFMSARCVYRTHCASFLPRIDAYLRL